MKKLLLFLIVFASLTVKAQTPKNFTQTADSCLSNLDKLGLTIGILYNRIYPFAGLNMFNLGTSDTSFNSYFHTSLVNILITKNKFAISI